MRRLTIVAALVASTAVFAADLAKDRFGEERSVYPNLGVAASAPAGAQYGDDALKLAPSMRLRVAKDLDLDVTYAARWRLPEAFGYHLSTLDAAGSEPAPAGDSRFRDDRSPWEGRRAPRVQF
ncbi:MAG TPA: hypothetical protein VE907_20235 [Gammaproteobacteria bacterium]|nr:hypothetical protein [Gammaproteobacteria bacterium]